MKDRMCADKRTNKQEGDRQAGMAVRHLSREAGKKEEGHGNRL